MSTESKEIKGRLASSDDRPEQTNNLSVGPLIVSIAGKTLSDQEKKLLASDKVGGLVLFKENYDEQAENPKENLKELIAKIRSINPNIVIMVDHEGGKVWRFNKGFTKLPAAKEYGILFDKDRKAALEKAAQDGYTMAFELLSCGIDMSLAPVVDLDGESNVIGKLSRAFHKDPVVVVEIAEAFISGMNKAGMPATLKHFPGHGTCLLDSHVDLPKDNRSLQELQKDLQPFKTLISKKLQLAVMSSFVVYPKVDSENVAAFSKTLLTGCLRLGCGYNRIIMSDCLSMKGADIGDNLKRLIKTHEAGNDFYLYTHQHGKELDALLSILSQIPDSKESSERRAQFLKELSRKHREVKRESESSKLLVSAFEHKAQQPSRTTVEHKAQSSSSSNSNAAAPANKTS